MEQEQSRRAALIRRRGEGEKYAASWQQPGSGRGRQRLAVLLLCVMLVAASALGMTGCSTSGRTAQSGSKQTVTDMEGRKVSIPEHPKRVACIYSSAAHMMAMLGVADNIVAVPNGVKSDALMSRKIKGLKDLSVPMQDNDLNVEELLDIRADLIIVKKDQIIAEGQTEKLKKAGIPWIVVDYDSRKELKQCITLMGDIFEKQKKADAYNTFAEKTVSEVKQRICTVNPPDRPAVYHSVNEAIRTDEPDGICREIMETAGVSDLAAEQDLERDGSKTYATLEEIYRWNPDGIIANESSVTTYILHDAKWAGLGAVKKKKVYTLPVGASRWCHPGSMEAHMGVLAVAWRFYPGAFRDFDLKRYTKEYYRKFFDLDLDDKTIENILSGKGMRRSNDAERK